MAKEQGDNEMKPRRPLLLFFLLCPILILKSMVFAEPGCNLYGPLEIFGKNLLISGKCFDLWLQPGSFVHGENGVNIIHGKMGRTFELIRSQGGNDGGAAGIVFPLNVSVSDLRHLYIKIKGEILYERGGNIANWNPRWFPEGALQIALDYLDKKGNRQKWYHGFYNLCKGKPDREHFTQRPLNTVFTWKSPDLLSLKTAPDILKALRVYGFGWGFKSRIYYIGFIGVSNESLKEGQKTCLLIPLKETPVFFYPSYKSEKFGTLNPGKGIEVLSFSKNGTWAGFDPGVAQACNVGPFRLRWAPLKGTAFLSGNCRNVPEIEPPQPRFCFVGGMETRVYKGPGEKYGLKGILRPDEYARAIFKTAGGWIFINMDAGKNGLYGYGWIRGSDTCFQGVGPCDRLPIKAFQDFSKGWFGR